MRGTWHPIRIPPGAHAGRWTSVQYHVRRQIPLNRIPYQPEVQVDASTCTCTGIAAFGVQAFAIGASISDGPVCINTLIQRRTFLLQNSLPCTSVSASETRGSGGAFDMHARVCVYAECAYDDVSNLL